MNYIRISDGKVTVRLPVKNNKISLQTIKAYFPGVSSLTYIENSEKCGVELCNEEFELVEGVTEYEIHCGQYLKGKLDGNFHSR